ncbi:MAG: hypothetical protein QOG34_2542 [Frankiaceae bacterium]|nr:hypothetical protein [Frankiaceae bacterium]
MGERVTNNANGSKVTTQVAVLASVLIIGLVGLVLGLAVLAHWSDGAVVGMLSAFGTIAAGLIIAVRNQQRAAETLDQLARSIGAGQRAQAVQLQTITKQTNEISDQERSKIAEQAAAVALEQHTGDQRRAA